MPLLRPLAPDLWVAERTFRNGLLEVSVRMTVLRQRDGSLLLHSAVELDRALRAELDALGRVRSIVAPNLHHHLFAADYPTGYPDARLYAAPGLPQKRPDLKFAEELSDVAPAAWRAELEQHLFRGAPFLNEVVLFHPASRTLVLTDLVMNVAKGDARGLSLLFFRLVGADGRFGPHRLLRYWFIRDRAAARGSVEHILAWDFDRVVMSHGRVLETGGRDAFRAAFDFLR
jgi:uncharacterized protein DUF4336